MPHRPRILITRTRHQASALAAKLEAFGAETIIVPTIELGPPSSYGPLDAAIESLGQPSHGFDWLVFTSANAVNAFRNRCHRKGIEVCPRSIAVIGPATLQALVDAEIAPQTGPVLMPASYVAESLASSLLATGNFDAAAPPPKHFLLVRAEEARDIIPDTLEAAGHRVTIAPAYRNITPPETVPALERLFASPGAQPDIITFTSSSTARNLFALLYSAGITLPQGITLASIGPITSATLRDLGHPPTLEAAEPTIDSLTAAIASSITQTLLPDQDQHG